MEELAEFVVDGRELNLSLLAGGVAKLRLQDALVLVDGPPAWWCEAPH